MDREERIYDFLDKLGISYEKYNHEAVMTIEQAAGIEEKIGLRIAKNLFMKNSKGHYLVLMPGEKKFDAKAVSKQLETSRMTFAKEDEMLELLDIKPGAVSPLGLINDKNKKVNFIVDREIRGVEKIAVHPCVNTTTVVMKTKILLEIVLPETGHDYRLVDSGKCS